MGFKASTVQLQSSCVQVVSWNEAWIVFYSGSLLPGSSLWQRYPPFHTNNMSSHGSFFLHLKSLWIHLQLPEESSAFKELFEKFRLTWVASAPEGQVITSLNFSCRDSTNHPSIHKITEAAVVNFSSQNSRPFVIFWCLCLMLSFGSFIPYWTNAYFIEKRVLRKCVELHR